ncbi:MAG: efflux transporter outer membrane subunit [Magnetococcales bacterium]|nr:efflux transporter outer membrane subunit [Magnetococcales bacterium]
MPVTPTRRLLGLCSSLVMMAGCAVMGPDYRRPPEVVPVAGWQAALPQGDTMPNPADWWARCEDPALSALLEATLARHPGLEGAKGAIDAARAALTGQQATDKPQVTLGGMANRSGNHPNPAVLSMSTAGMTVDAGWELDLFGRVKRATEGARAKVAAREAELQGLRVALAAEVATLYADLRGCERMVTSMEEEIASRIKSVEATRAAIRAGLTAASEGDLAEAGLGDARSQAIAQQGLCDSTVKGLVALSGLQEPEVRQRLQPGRGRLPRMAPFVVNMVPAQLLGQRPDLASAEAELMAANAGIGEAEANRWPRFSLLGSVGSSSSAMGSVTLRNQPWSFGPALQLPVFDAGVRAANVRAAEAKRRIALANYRQAVTNAVREVESALVNLASTRERSTDTRKAAAGFAAFFAASQEHWHKGGISLLTLEDARRKSIGAERAVIDLERREAQQWINLYKALGGGWTPGEER